MTQVFLVLALAVPGQGGSVTYTYEGGGGSIKITIHPGGSYPTLRGSNGPVIHKRVNYQRDETGIVATQDGKIQHLLDTRPFRVGKPAEVPPLPASAAGPVLVQGQPPRMAPASTWPLGDRTCEEAKNLWMGLAGQPMTKGVRTTLFEYVRDEFAKRNAKKASEKLEMDPEISDVLITIIMAAVTRSAKAPLVWNTLFDSAATGSGEHGLKTISKGVAQQEAIKETMARLDSLLAETEKQLNASPQPSYQELGRLALRRAVIHSLRRDVENAKRKFLGQPALLSIPMPYNR